MNSENNNNSQTADSPKPGVGAAAKAQKDDTPATVASAADSEDLGRTGDEQLADQISEDLLELDELALAKARAQEVNDKFLRLKAEWENYRKRTEGERADERSRATQHLLVRILPVIDDLELAIKHSADADVAAMREGIVQVLNKLTSTLAAEGLKTIDPQGENFDAHRHNAISKLEDASVPEDTVLEVFQKGYELAGRVLRPAMVVVSGAPR
jgi:molecular chaperone GrpE